MRNGKLGTGEEEEDVEVGCIVNSRVEAEGSGLEGGACDMVVRG